MYVPQLIVLWYHKVLEETSYGISNALSMLGIDHKLRQSSSCEIIDTGDLFIIVGVHHFSRLPSNFIIFQVEQPRSNWFKPSLYEAFRKCLCIIDFSPRLVTKWKSMGYNSFYVPIRIPMTCFLDRSYLVSDKEDIDVLFYGGLVNRRSILEKRLREKLPGKIILFRYYDLFGEEREEKIFRSKIVLNVHFWPESSLETHRIEYLLARGKCVVSERSMDEDLDKEYEDSVRFCSYYNIADEVKYLLDHPKDIQTFGSRGRQVAEKHQFDTSPLKSALSGIYDNPGTRVEARGKSEDFGTRGHLQSPTSVHVDHPSGHLQDPAFI